MTAPRIRTSVQTRERILLVIFFMINPSMLLMFVLLKPTDDAPAPKRLLNYKCPLGCRFDPSISCPIGLTPLALVDSSILYHIHILVYKNMQNCLIANRFRSAPQKLPVPQRRNTVHCFYLLYVPEEPKSDRYFLQLQNFR